MVPGPEVCGPARHLCLSNAGWEWGLARISQILMCWRFGCDLDTSLRSPGTLVAIDAGCGAANLRPAWPAGGVKSAAASLRRRRRCHSRYLRNHCFWNAREARGEQLFLPLGVSAVPNSLDRFTPGFF